MIRPLILLLSLASADPAPKPSVADDKAIELFREGKFDDALAELQKAAKANPALAPPRVRLAEMFMQSGRPVDARAYLEQAAVEDPIHPAMLLMNANFAFAEGRVTDTILSCQAVLRASTAARWTDDQRKRFIREARMGLAAGFEARRDWVVVKEQLAAVLNDDPKNAIARQKTGVALFWLDNPEQALAELQKAFDDDPTLDLPELRMAQLWTAKDDSSKTEDWLKKAVAAHPKDARGHRAYASWLLDNGRPESAQLYVESSSKIDPTNRETTGLKGLLARYRKEHAVAEQVFEGLVKDYPNDTYAAWNLALSLAESSDATKKRRAIDLAEAEAKKNPQVSEGYAVLGWCYYKAGRTDDADKALGQSARGGQVRLDTAYFMARLLADKNRIADAHKIVKDALAGRGPFVYRSEAAKLLEELDPKLPKKDPPKKP